MMNQVNHGESSSSPSGVKRRRGRPRKDHNTPPGFKKAKEYPPLGDDNTVGQTVTGVIEATFDAGFLLTVKIGNSNTNLRGVVFKPGHSVPVTAANDVAPHVQMIRRNTVDVPAENQGRARAQKLTVQRASRKVAPPVKAPSVSPGTLVPVVSQPASFPVGFPCSNQTPHVLSFGDIDMNMVEPVSMLPPDRSVPVGQIFASHLAGQGSQLSDNYSYDQGNSEVGQGDKSKLMISTDIGIPDSSLTSDTRIKNCKEEPKSLAEESSNVSNTFEAFSTDSLQTASVPIPFFNFTAGRMTELLQAVQGNMKENQMQFAERPS